MVRVDFMILGAQKCATNTLFTILQRHPALIGSAPNEPHFFCRSPDWRSELDAYHALFEEKEGVQYFESSTTYTFYPLRNLHIWDDLYAYNPDLKFIYLVRNPIDRIVSGYMHTYQRGYTDRPFEESLIKNRMYLDITRYYTQIIPYIRRFGRDQVLLLDFDDLTQRTEATIQQVCAFLNINFDAFGTLEKTHRNPSLGRTKKHHKYDHPSWLLARIRDHLPPLWEKITDNSRRHFTEKPKPSPALQQMILQMLEVEIRELETLMGKNLSKWKRIQKG